MLCPEKLVTAAHDALDAMDLGEPEPNTPTGCDPGCSGPVIEVRSNPVRRAMHSLMPSIVTREIEVPVCKQVSTLQTP